MANFTLPVGKQEFHDGTNWFALASENWVLNTLSQVTPCRVATSTPINQVTYANGTNGVGATLTNASSINAPLGLEGINLSLNDRVLVKDQPAALQNGIYTVTTVGTATVPWVLTRATDFDSPSQMTKGKIISVIDSSPFINNNSLWVLSVDVSAVGTSPLSFFLVNDNSFVSAVLNPCYAASTQNLVATYANGSSGVGATLTYSGSTQEQYYFQVDGQNMTNGTRVLIKDQTIKSQNGVYVLTERGSTTVPWVLTRATEYDTSSEMSKGQLIPVLKGNTLSQTMWVNSEAVSTVGTTDIVFNQFKGSNSSTGTENQITVNTINGNTTIGLATNPVIPGNGSITIPKGTTAQRPTSPLAGMIRLNTSL